MRMRWRGVVACVLVVAYAATAEAKTKVYDELTEEQQSQVNGWLLEAKESIEAGDYERALERLDRAYEVFDHPKILLKKGMAHQSLGNDAEAIALYEKFIEEMPEDPEVAEINGRISHLQERLYGANSTLTVKTSPAGATVVVRGGEEEVARGTTPLELKVRAGAYTLEISRPGYIAQTERVVMKYNEKAALVYELAAPPELQKPGALQWTLVGIGAASSVAAIGVGAWWFTEDQRWYELGAELDRTTDQGEREELTAQRRELTAANNNRALVFYTTAGVGVATLVTAWLLWPSDAPAVSVVPITGGGEVRVQARF